MNAETEIALANLDWLIHNRDMRLDYGARAVLYANGEPGYVLDDLAAIGLTPATRHWDGRLPIEICYEAVTSPYGVRPHMRKTSEELKREKEIAEQLYSSPPKPLPLSGSDSQSRYSGESGCPSTAGSDTSRIDPILPMVLLCRGCRACARASAAAARARWRMAC